MTFAELCQAIGAWLNDPQVEPSIPTFITLAEAHINRRLAEARLPSATVRASFSIYNTETEVDALVEALHFARKRLRLA